MSISLFFNEKKIILCFSNFQTTPLQNSSVAVCSVPWKKAHQERTSLFFWLSVLARWKVLPVPATSSLSALLISESWDVLLCSCYSGLKTLAKWLVLFINAGCCLGLYMFPLLKHLFFFDIFVLFILKPLFQTPHFAVTCCLSASSPAGQSVQSSCNLFSF